MTVFLTYKNGIYGVDSRSDYKLLCKLRQEANIDKLVSNSNINNLITVANKYDITVIVTNKHTNEVSFLTGKQPKN